MATGCLCVCLYVCLSICLSVYLSVSACILFLHVLICSCLYVCLSLNFMLGLCLCLFARACGFVCGCVARLPRPPPRVHSLLVTESVIATNTIKTPCLSIS